LTTACQPFGADGLQRRHELATGVVDQAVHRAMRGHNGGHGLFDRVFLADVTHLKTDCATILRDFVRHRLQLLNLAPHQRHLGTQCASSCATQRPMPEPPPVTTTTLPANRLGAKTEP
jgi:hypothetical protein